MDIIHFDRFRAGVYPVSIDMRSDRDNGLHTLIGSVSLFEKWVQVRRKDSTLALVIYQYDDEPLPEWWQDSELLWEFKP